MFSAVTFNITLNNDITVVLKDLETSLCPPLSRLMLFALDPLITASFVCERQTSGFKMFLNFAFYKENKSE